MAVVAPILAIAALTWGLVWSLRGSLAIAAVVVLVVGYVFGHEFLNFDLGPLPLTLDRILLCGFAAAYLIQRWLRLNDPKKLTATDFALLGFVAILTLSTFTHDWRIGYADQVSPLWLLVAGYLTPVALYFLARDARLTPPVLYGIYGLLFLFGIYLTFTALAEITGTWSVVFPRYISDPKLGIHFGRARGPLLQSQSLGLQISMCLLCGWALLAKMPRGGKLAYFFMIPLFAAALFFTYTRCVWIGAVLGGTIVLLLWLRGEWKQMAILAILGVGLLVPTVCWDSIVGIQRDAGTVAARESVSQRASFTYVSWKMFQDRPLFGFGFGQFVEAKQPYLSDRSTSLYLEAIRYQPHHNTFLSLLTETGLVGLGLYLLVLFGWIHAAWKLLRNGKATSAARTQGIVMLGAIGIYLGPALFFDLTYSPHDHWILFLLAGLTVGLYGESLETSRARSSVPSLLATSPLQTDITAGCR